MVEAPLVVRGKGPRGRGGQLNGINRQTVQDLIFFMLDLKSVLREAKGVIFKSFLKLSGDFLFGKERRELWFRLS
jgi:hypothetical protein